MKRALVTHWIVAWSLMAAFAAHPADITGGWQGIWTKDGDALPVAVTFEKSGGGYSGWFDSDALQVAHIPFAEVREAGGKVHFVLKGDATTSVFDGAKKGNTLEGGFTEGESKGTFVLTRAALPQAAVASRNVTFTDGDVKLAGTLLLPPTPGKHPAVMFLHGSGPEGRWANRWLAQKFAVAGIVALISDKRGVGGSTGDWKRVGFEPLADDAAAGVRFLEKQPEVDVGRIGIYGHSQGGTIAPLVVERAQEIAFVVASAPGGIPPADLETYSVENSIGVASLPPKEAEDARAFVRAIVDVGCRGASRAELDTVAAKYKGRSWYFDAPPTDNSYWTISRQIASFDPSAHWRHVQVPVLLLFGAHDERVPSIQSATAIRMAIAQEARRTRSDLRVTIKIYPDADHTFTIVDPPRKTGWPRHEVDYALTITGWIQKLQ